MARLTVSHPSLGEMNESCAVPQLPPAGASLARDAAKPASRNSGKPGADRTGAEILGATSPYRRSLATRWMRWACSRRQKRVDMRTAAAGCPSLSIDVYWTVVG